MSLDLFNYLENIRLRAEVERQAVLWNFVTNHPFRALAKFLLSPFLVAVRYIRNHLLARKIAPLVVSNPASDPVSDEVYFHVTTQDQVSNQFLVKLSVYNNKVLDVAVDPESKFLLLLRSGNSKLLIIHAFYKEEALCIFDNLKNFHDYDIVLTTCNPEIRDNFADLFDSAKSACFLMPNIGRDVLPFLLILKLVDLSSYTHFVKVHTKRSSHLSDNGRWFRRNIDVLIGNKLMTDRIFDHIRPEYPSIYGVECLPLQDHLENNWNWLMFMFKQSPEDVEGCFVPGTMFAGSAKFLRELAEKNFHLLRLEEERGQLDGCLVHALERYFGYLATSGGGECNTLEMLALGESLK
jgi:hypothetical protein